MQLSQNWLTEDLIDFEYKKYLVLGYLQEVQNSYKDTMLYPWLADIIQHYKQLVSFKNTAQELQQHFHKGLKGIDFKELKLVYENEENNELMEELKHIIDFATPLFYSTIQEGKQLFDRVEKHLHIQTIGLLPIHKTEGYMLLHAEKNKEVIVYQYRFSDIQNSEGTYKALHTSYMTTYTQSLMVSYETIKSDLISNNKELPNPAVYAIDCAIQVPFKETFLPIAKRYFVQHFSKATA